MAITAISHSVCLDCSENSFTITGSITGAVGTPTNTLYVTDPSGNVTTYDNTKLGTSLYTSPFTFTVQSSDTSISGSSSVHRATLSWTVSNNTTYSFIIRSMVSGNIQDYVVSFESDSSATATEIGQGLTAIIDALPPSLNLLPVSYTPGQTSLTVEGNTNVFFGVDALVNVTAGAITANQDISSTFEDGIYIVQWNLTDAPNSLTSITNSIFLCNVEKCVREKASKVDVGCGCCGSRESEEAMDAIMYLEGIKSAAACGKLEKAKTILSGLEDICNNDCKHC